MEVSGMEVSRTGGQNWPEWHSGKVYAVAFSLDGKLVASASGDKKVRLMSLQQERRLRLKPLPKTNLGLETSVVSYVLF